MVKSLCCPSETITTLLISYTRVENKKFFKNKRKEIKKKQSRDVSSEHWAGELRSIPQQANQNLERRPDASVLGDWNKRSGHLQLKVKVSVPQSCRTLCNPMDFSLPWLFSRRENWRELPFPPQGNLPDPGIELVSPLSPALQVDFLAPEPSEKPWRTPQNLGP